jgi:hypothetical protein
MFIGPITNAEEFPMLEFGSAWLAFIAYVAICIFVIRLVWRIAKAGERIADALERRPLQ